MAAQAFGRGLVAFAIVLVAGTVVQALGAPEPATPEPSFSFGDHADYNVTVVDLETGRERPAVVSNLAVEVGAAATVADAQGRPVLAVPLEFSFAFPTLGGEPGQVARTYWLDGGRVVAVGTKGTGSVARGDLVLPGTAPEAGSTQSIAWSDLRWNGAELPCGFGLQAAAAGAAGCTSHRQEGTPWPAVATAPLADLLGSPGEGPLAHRLTLAWSGRSLGLWSSPAAIAALPPPMQAPRGSMGPSGEGPGAFPLADAFRELQAAPTDPAARDLLQRHPDAYVAYARSYDAVDAAGNVQRAWHLVLVGGTERVERAVVQDPGLAPMLPETIRVLQPSDLDYPVEAAPAVLPPVGLAPATLPDLDGLRLAFSVATGREATGWGFAVSCPTRSCFEVEARLVLLAEDLAEAGPSTSAARWQRPMAARDVVAVDGAGELLAVERVEYGRPVPNLLAHGPLEPRDAPAADGIAFPFPSAPTAVTVGALGLVAAVLAAAWPALKVYVPLFSRIEASRMLDHPVRRRVHDLVHQEPGIHSREVATRLGIGGNTAHHHLERLVGAGYLGERRIAGYHCYFPRGGLDERLQDAVPVLKSRGAQAVLLAVMAQGAPSFRSLMAATGLGYATVHHHAERLWKAGLVSAEKDGKARRFRLTELGRLVSGQAQASLDRFPKLAKNAPEMDGTA